MYQIQIHDMNGTNRFYSLYEDNNELLLMATLKQVVQELQRREREEVGNLDREYHDAGIEELEF